MKSEDWKTRYRCGYCDAFALAVHERTGWPLMLWGVHEPDEDDGDLIFFQPLHACLGDPNGRERWFDVDGWHEGLGVPGNLVIPDHLASFSVTCQPATEDEIRHAFAVSEGVGEEELAMARQDLERSGLLTPQPTVHFRRRTP